MRPAKPWRLRGWVACVTAAVLALGPAAVAAADAGAPLPPHLPLKREPAASADAISWWPGALLVAGVLVLGGALVRRRQGGGWLRGWRPAGDPPGVTRLSAQALTPQASLHVVRWHGEELLLGCCAQQVTLLARRAVRDDPGAPP